MRRLTRWIAKHAIVDWERTQVAAVRTRYGMLEGWVSIVGNLVLAGIKLALGFALQSTGLIADAVHSLSDMASSIVIIISFRVAGKPPDREHPFGHAKAEYIATLIVALMMIVAGWQIGQESVGGWLAERGGVAAALPPLTWALFAVLAVLLLAKEAMAVFSRELGRMIGSNALEADAWHHRTDAMTTGVVIVGLLGRNWGLLWLDGAAGLLVAAWVAYTGARLAYDTISPLLGETASPEEAEAIRNLVRSVPEVASCHDITVHRYGHFHFTTVHAEISDRLDVHAMHEVTVVIETRILKRFPGECVVHVDPVNLHHPLLNRVSDLMRDVVVAHAHLVEFRDLNLWNDNGSECGSVEISVDPELPEGDYATVAEDVRGQVVGKFPGLTFAVLLKVDFTASPIAK